MRLLSRWFRRPGAPTYHPGCPECAGLDALVQSKDVAGLIDVLKTDRRHQSEAAASLAYLTGHDIGRDPASWKSWSRNQKSRADAAVG
jgi:hypothetical protein